MTLLTLTKSLPLAYNRDLQEDKEPVFDTADTVASTLRVLVRLLPEIQFHRERMATMAEQGFTLATDLADYLVRKGLPFRKAHFVVGQLVQHCAQQDKRLQECSLEEFKKFHKGIDNDIYSFLRLDSAVDRRASMGGTASSRVRQALDQAHGELDAKKVLLDL
jgi:argininosuccinate lyase